MFYVYDQNNSGGFHITDEDRAQLVIVEADSEDDADQRLSDMYFYDDH